MCCLFLCQFLFSAHVWWVIINIYFYFKFRWRSVKGFGAAQCQILPFAIGYQSSSSLQLCRSTVRSQSFTRRQHFCQNCTVFKYEGIYFGLYKCTRFHSQSITPVYQFHCYRPLVDLLVVKVEQSDLSTFWQFLSALHRSHSNVKVIDQSSRS